MFAILTLLTTREATIRDCAGDLVRYRDPRRAQQDLEVLRMALPDALFQSLGPLLSDSPDPDQALILLQRFIGRHPQAVTLLAQHRALAQRVFAIFGYSFWLGETLLRHPDLLSSLAVEKSLERSFQRDDFSHRLDELCSRASVASTALLLTQFRNREYVRIALRDILGIATLGETIADISALTDVIIQRALRESALQMAERYGESVVPGRFAVLALGKLGGNELNYSSDLDLLYLYDGNQSAHEISAAEYFVRQAQVLTGILSRRTEEGALFRVDLRLRPQGREGEPAVSLQHALDYYRGTARDWEFQALIKARHVAGDAILSQRFLRGVQSHVYTEQLNFVAIETALRSRREMDAQRRRAMPLRHTHLLDVKLDPGGIRDIEFLVQCLQRVYGGTEPWLRSGGTLFSLQKLHDKGHLEQSDFQQLSQAYQFLRVVEHRLQLRRGQQVHQLPESTDELEILERALDGSGAVQPGSLVVKTRSFMDSVSQIYRRVIHNAKNRETRGPISDVLFVSEQERSFSQLLERIAARSVVLADRIGATHLSPHAQRALHRFLTSAIAGDEKHWSLLENPQIFARVLLLLESSGFLEGMLDRHPELICVLQDPALKPRQVSDQPGSGPARFDPDQELAATMAALRRQFREDIFASGARDVATARPALESMHDTTSAAEAAIRHALRAVGGEQAIAVFALGRLGTYEFDIASDADLLFIRRPGADSQEARIVAEKLLHALAAYTRDGALFAVDARLRPHGGEGELVVTPAQLESYLADEALAWEALSYTKLRFVAGNRDLATEVLEQARRRIFEIAHEPAFPQQVLEMRGRLEKSNRYARSFKLACGGFYDIDFIAAFLMLRGVNLHEGNTLERLEHLQRAGLLDRNSFTALANATVLFRTTDHVIRLVTGRAVPELPQAEHAREATIRLVKRMLQHGMASGDAQADLEAAQDEVRRLFLELIRG